MGCRFQKIRKRGWFEADGSKSLKYCSYCYDSGKFVNPEMTPDEMKVLVKGKLKEMGFPGFIAGFFTRGIPKLERWKN